MPAWQLLPPETAHALAIWALRRGLAPTVTPPASPRLRSAFCGFEPHPLGLAAGFDKNALAVSGLFGLGFSFVEVGTVTPQPQEPRPRLFRLRAQQALINRMGFNNDGLEAVRARLAGQEACPGPLGANIGANRDARTRCRLRRLPARAVRAGRLSHGQRVVTEHAGAARSAGRARLDELLAALVEARSALAGSSHTAAAAQDRSGSGAGRRGRDCRGGARATSTA